MSGETDVVLLPGRDKTLHLKEGDRRPVLRARLLDGGEPIDLESHDPGVRGVRLNMWDTWDTDQMIVDGGRVEIADAADGIVEYHWGTGDVDLPGQFDAEFQVLFTDRTEKSFPNTDNFTVNIQHR